MPLAIAVIWGKRPKRDDAVLFQTVLNVCESRFETTRDALYSGKYDNRNATRDQGVFNGRSARLIFQKSAERCHL